MDRDCLDGDTPNGGPLGIVFFQWTWWRTIGQSGLFVKLPMIGLAANCLPLLRKSRPSVCFNKIIEQWRVNIANWPANVVFQWSHFICRNSSGTSERPPQWQQLTDNSDDDNSSAIFRSGVSSSDKLFYWCNYNISKLHKVLIEYRHRLFASKGI